MISAWMLLLLGALVGPLPSITHASIIVVPTNETASAPETTDIPAVTKTATDGTTVLTSDTGYTTIISHPTEAPEMTSTVAPDATEERTSADLVTETPSNMDTSIADRSTALPTMVVYKDDDMDMTGSQSTVVIEDNEEGLSAAQVAGIVLGSLVAVAVIIAVVVMGMRRMGQYSP